MSQGDFQILSHVPRFLSSPIVAVVAETPELREGVLVRVVDWPTQLRDPALSPNPVLKVVPCLHTKGGDGFSLVVESTAIMECLFEQCAAPPPLWVAPGDPARAGYLTLLAFAAGTVKPLLSDQIFMGRLAAGKLAATSRDQAAGEPTAEAQLRATLKMEFKMEDVAAGIASFVEKVGPFLSQRLGDSEFFCAGRLTAVDFFIAKPLGNALATPADGALEPAPGARCLLDDFPTLKAHVQRMQARRSHTLAYSPVEMGADIYRIGAGEGEPGEQPLSFVRPSMEELLRA